MKTIFKQLREAAAEVAEAWGVANHFEVDLDSAEIVMLSRPWTGRVRYTAVSYGGHISTCSVAFEPKVNDMVVFAQGAKVVRFSMVPYRLDWEAKVDHACRNSQGMAVCRALWANAERVKE